VLPFPIKIPSQAKRGLVFTFCVEHVAKDGFAYDTYDASVDKERCDSVRV